MEGHRGGETEQQKDTAGKRQRRYTAEGHREGTPRRRDTAEVYGRGTPRRRDRAAEGHGGYTLRRDIAVEHTAGGRRHDGGKTAGWRRDGGGMAAVHHEVTRWRKDTAEGHRILDRLLNGVG